MSLRKSHFCRAPSERVEIAVTGDVFLCCPGWVRGAVGNLNFNTLDEIWRGEKAEALRASVRDGSYSYCSSDVCPHLQALDTGTNLPAYSPIESFAAPRTDHAHLIGQGKTPDGPVETNAIFDLTCNLSCPTCRKSPVIFQTGTPERQSAEKIANGIIKAYPNMRRLKIAGNGDPFASKVYWRMLTAIDRELHPNLRVMLHTNGLLFNAARWNELHKAHGLIDTVEVSVDAASGETYALNRRGGSFESLLERLDFISKLRTDGEIRRLLISFVVQANNFREMPAFVELGRKLQADTIIFSRLNDWGTFPPAILANRSIHLRTHPLHAEFTQLLANSLFKENGVFVGNLSEFFPKSTGSPAPSSPATDNS